MKVQNYSVKISPVPAFTEQVL
uniref:Uncharacterized protein n=1 Tax=Arundo donax TaxID=35708 RepID=A0A0A8YAI9_ARUDO